MISIRERDMPASYSWGGFGLSAKAAALDLWRRKDCGHGVFPDHGGQVFLQRLS
jgi:hypothetical protein